MEVGRVPVEANARDQVRAVRRIAQVVVESARPGIGPVDDFVDGAAARGFGIEQADFGEPFA